MKLVSENLNEFLNKANMELFYVVNTDPGYYDIVDKNNKTLWSGSYSEAVTFLLRNAGVDNSFEAKIILTKADKFGGKEMISGDTIYKKGPYQNKDLGMGAKVPGAPIMIQPFMFNKEIRSGKYYSPRKSIATEIRKNKNLG